MKGLMIQGTSSDVGKSVLCTALCRVFHRRGLKVAPFKSQNMSNNSYVTNDGGEIGRAQGIQAEAANVEATVYMNPILLKPRNDCTSEVILFGKPYNSYSGKDYRQHFYEVGLKAIEQAKLKLSEQFDYLIVEGAGSPVEINLNDRELVNMKVAEKLDLPVILVADIDRGGVFASVIGTLQLLTKEEKKRVKGIIINKFRGDLSLFQNGVLWLEEYTGIPVLGVVPFMTNLAIEAEDSLALSLFQSKQKRAIDIAVIKLPYVSNFTDLEPFRFEEDVSLRFVADGSELGDPDAVIIPGTKSTINDLLFLKKQNLVEKLIEYGKNNGTIIGICGGYQMLGELIIDKAGTDTGTVGQQVKGFGLLPLQTQFEQEKQVKYSHGKIAVGNKKMTVTGYEIHLGRTELLKTDHTIKGFIELEDGSFDGVTNETGKIIGTYFHHIFHNDEWRNFWLNEIRKKKNLAEKSIDASLFYEKRKQAAYDQLELFFQEHVNITEIFEIVHQWSQENVV